MFESMPTARSARPPAPSGATRPGAFTASAASLLLVLLAVFAGSAGAFPRTITDALGREVTIPAPPQRIVSIFASNTELLVALGLEDRIVGVEDYTKYPPGIRESRTIVGGRLGFSAEAIARLEPDLVVMTPARQAASSLLRPMAAAGIPAIVLLHKDLEQVFGNLRLLGQATGEEQQAELVIHELRDRLQQVRLRIADAPPRRVYFETGETDRGGFMTLRPGTYTFDALEAAGGRSVFATLRGLTQVSGEAVIQADPDVVLVARRDMDMSGVRGRVGWQGISAIRAGHVYPVDRALLLIPGPRVVDGVEQMARLLHPERFETP